MKEIRDLRYNDIPTNLISRRCKTKLKALLASPDGNKVSDEYNHTDVRKKLRKYHGLKCVYCESSPIATSTFRVDHFRPKKYIKELPKTKHRGYYWLAYEWSNLLQSCELLSLLQFYLVCFEFLPNQDNDLLAIQALTSWNQTLPH